MIRGAVADSRVADARGTCMAATLQCRGDVGGGRVGGSCGTEVWGQREPGLLLAATVSRGAIAGRADVYGICVLAASEAASAIGAQKAVTDGPSFSCSACHPPS